MRDVNLLIKQNVDIKKSLTLLDNIEMYNQTIDQFLEKINGFNKKLNEYYLEKNLSKYAELVEELKKITQELGFNDLSAIALKHEINAKTKDYSYIEENYNELLMCIENVIDIAKKYQESNVEPEKLSQEEKKNDNNSKKILIADDSIIVRNLIKRMVKEEYELIEAEDGKKAIDILKEQSENIFGIFLDLNMPNISGFEVLEHLSNNNLFGKISVSIITGDDSKETVMKAFDYPIVDVLAKPFNENDVKRVITAMLTHK